LPGEMVTTGAIVEWRDRTDAKPQPETASKVTTDNASLPAVDDVLAMDEPEPEPALVEDRSEDNPDGFDYSTLQEEDVEEPEPVR
jgi:hypothetical protein